MKISDIFGWKSYMYRVLKYCIFFQMTAKEFVESGGHQLEPPSAFHLGKKTGISGSAVSGTLFVASSHWKIPRKSGKSEKVGLFSRLEFPNRMSCSIYVSRSLYQFQVHCQAPWRTGVYDQMEQLFTNRKFHFCSHRNFRVFFLNGERPPSPLIPWVNPFLSRFINRTAYFPQNVSYFRESCMSPWKNKVGWSQNQKPVLRTCIFLSFYASIFYDFTAAGIWVSWNKSQWITQLRLSMKWWDKGSELRITERLSLRVLFLIFCRHTFHM